MDFTGGRGSAGATSPLRVGAVLGLVVLAAVVIFSLGVMVGERVTGSVLPPAPPPTALPTEGLVPVPVSPPPPVASGAANPIPPDTLTFYDRLSGKAPAGPPPLPEGQAPPPAAVSTDPATGQRPAPAVTPSPDPPPPKTVNAEAAKPQILPGRSVAPPEARKTASAASAPQPAAPPPADDAVAKIRRLMGKGGFQVQIAASQQREGVNDIVARYKKQGFDVITTMAMVKGKTWYRVRVGSFPNQQAAKRAAGIFKNALGLEGMVVRE